MKHICSEPGLLQSANQEPANTINNDGFAKLNSDQRRLFLGRSKFFGHYVHFFFLLLAITEILVLIATTYLTIRLQETGMEELSVVGVLPKSVFFSLIVVLCMAAIGLYDTSQRESFPGILRRILVGYFIGIISVSLLTSIITAFSIWAYLPTVAIVGLVPIIAIHLFFYRYLDNDISRRRVLVIGTGDKASSINELRRKSDRRGFTVIGFAPAASAHDIQVDTNKIIQPNEPLCDYALKHNIDEIVVALDDHRQRLPLEELVESRMRGIHIIDIAGFFERETGRLKLNLLQPSWIIFSSGFDRRGLRMKIKRLADIFACFILLVGSFPLLFAATVAILIESKGKGPILYRQKRVGQNGEIFELLKLRSMRTDAEQDGKARWASKDDPRVTRVGAIIRKYRIDELPQVFNVLKGNMSLVGPRPERPPFVKELEALSPFYQDRHRVKPGITGWAQLNYPYGATREDSLKKLEYDLYYVKNVSLVLDLCIIFQTLEIILFAKGSR